MSMFSSFTITSFAHLLAINMFQEAETQKPVIVSRNHNARKRPQIFRWTTPPDWDPAWNRKASLLTGLTFGVSTALYH